MHLGERTDWYAASLNPLTHFNPKETLHEETTHQPRHRRRLRAACCRAQQSVEVLHWWTSGGEAAALNVLKGNLEKQGVKWNDMPVAGGGGEQAMTAVRARVTAGNPPTAVQMLGFDILDWGKQGVLADLNALAAKDGWDKMVPPALQKFSKYNGKWIAAPVNVHSTNWVWANKEVLAKAGVTTEPKNCDEFIAAAEKVQKAGFIAHRARRPALAGRHASSTASCCPPAASTTTARPSSSSTRRR